MAEQDFSWRAFQGETVSFVVTLGTTSLDGSQALTAIISRGDHQAALLTITPTWDSSASQTSPPTLIDATIQGMDLSALAPGAYSVLISVASGGPALAKGLLEVYPGPGGLAPAFYRALASPALAQSLLPELNRDQIDTLYTVLISATRIIETYCGRSLFLDSYDHIIRPKSGSIRLKLRSRPIVEVSRVSADVIPGVTVSNNGLGTLSNATMQTITTAPNSMQIGSLVFTTTLAGVATPQTLTMSDYATFADLETAINALGNGWSATSQVTSSGLPVADAFGTPGTRNCLNQPIWVHTHSEPLGQWWTEPDQGFIEINEPIPGGFLVPNPRVERTDTRYWGVRVTYRAGYAYLAADVALGYYPVPEDLAIACVLTANNIIESVPLSGPVKSQSVKDRSYTLKDELSLIPEAARVVLASTTYSDVVF